MAAVVVLVTWGTTTTTAGFTKCVIKSSAVDPDPELFVPNPTKMKEQIHVDSVV